MCGLVGVVGKILGKEEAVFKMLLQLDTIRGPDSTGIAAVDKDGKIMVTKSVGTAWDLQMYKEYHDIFRGWHACLIGHNRWATKGKITDDNAHPFQFENVVGAHNGTITSGHRLDDFHKFEVDSKAFYNHVNKNGLQDALDKADGAFALAFYDAAEHELKLARNTQRPLSFAFSKDGKTMIWASEPWMIAIACQKNDLEIEPIQEVEINTLYRFPVPKDHASSFAGYNEAYYKEPISFFDWKKYSHYSGNNGGNSEGKKEESGKVVKGNFPAKRPGFDIQEYKDTLVEFGIEKTIIDPQGSGSYVLGWTDDARNLPVRVYCGLNTDTYKMLCKRNTYFSGTCVSIGWHNNNEFIIIKPSTIKEVVMDDSGVDQEGKKCSAEKFYLITEPGCGVCGEFPQIKDARSLIWINKEDFICHGCSKTQDGQMLINYYSNSAVGG